MNTTRLWQKLQTLFLSDATLIAERFAQHISFEAFHIGRIKREFADTLKQRLKSGEGVSVLDVNLQLGKKLEIT